MGGGWGEIWGSGLRGRAIGMLIRMADYLALRRERLALHVEVE